MSFLDHDHPGVKIPPPLVYVGCMAISYGCHRSWPVSMGYASVLQFFGLALFVIAFSSLVYLLRLFKANDTEVEPWKTTHNLIVNGPFKYSRNPIYVCFSLILIAAGLIANSYFVLFSFVPASVIVYQTAIKKEEQYLIMKFGEQYRAYMKGVPRWLLFF